MIADRIGEIGRYAALSPDFAKAVAFLKGHDFKGDILPESGGKRYDIDGNRVYATLSKITTGEPDFSRWEAHRRYADIQLVLEGGEEIRFLSLEKCQEEIPYSEERDVAFYRGGEGTVLRCEAGDFAVFFPEDAHLPCCKCPEHEGSLKLVVKVWVDC